MQSRAADVLAGEPAADDIDGNSIGSEPCCGELSDILVDRDVRPVVSEDGLAIRLSLTEGDCSHPGSFESERESANPAEEVEDIHAVLRRETR